MLRCVALLLAMLMISYPIASAQTIVDSTSFEGSWGSFTPSNATQESDFVSPTLSTAVDHTGSYSAFASGGNGQQSFIGNFYGGQSAVAVPYVVTVWIYVGTQSGGNLEFEKFFGFQNSVQTQGGSAYWLAAVLRSADGYAMIRTSAEQKSSYFISIKAWHKYTVSYDGTTLALLVDNSPVIADTNAAGQQYLAAVNLGVLDNVNSQSSTRSADIGYGAVYVDDYIAEQGAAVQTATATSTIPTTVLQFQNVTVTNVVEIVPGYVYGLLPVIAVIGVLAGYGIVRLRSPRKATVAASSAVASRCVKCGAELPQGSKFCDNCGASQER
jgi:zinc-ribbon domain